MTESAQEEQKEESGEFQAEKIPGLLIANYSIIAAILAYMGWSYQESYYGNFQVHPIDLGAGLAEYLIRSVSLFNPGFVVLSVVIVAIAGSRARIISYIQQESPRVAAYWDWASRRLTTRAETSGGPALVALTLILILIAKFVPISIYLLLTLLASGPIFLARNSRNGSNNRGLRVLVSAIVAVCALWAGSVYSHNQGIAAARQLVATLPDRSAVEVFSVNRLAISGTGVKENPLPAGNFYHYYYTGLRLLTMRSGTYYLLPLGWTPKNDPTYIVDSSDQIRINLYGGVQPVGSG